MKILLVQKLSYLPTLSGAHRVNRLVLEALAARSHSCCVVAPASASQDAKGRTRLRHEMEAQGIRLHVSSPAADVFHYHGVELHAVADDSYFCAYLVDQIGQFQPTWTLVSEDRAFFCLEAALQISPGRVVFLAHSQTTLPFGPECFRADPTKSHLLRQAAGIVVISEYLKEYLRRWGGLEATVIRYPVYGAGPFPRWGRFDRGYVMMVNPSPVKGIPIFLELARRMPEVPFAAVPTWGTRAADRAALERLPNVRLLEPVENIDKILTHARVVLVPSLWGEAFGLIAVEAMLRGIPVLASNVGGLPEAKLGVDYLLPVRPVTGYEERLDERYLPIPIIPEQDIGPWQQALAELLTRRDRYERLADASRDAALGYIQALDIGAFEAYLEGLAPSAALAPKSIHPEGDVPNGDLPALDQLSPERLALLAQLLDKKATKEPGRESIPRLPRGGPSDSFPLSFGQQRLWFLDQLNSGSPVYNTVAAVHIKGSLDLGILERSLNEIVRRHEAWRSTFPVVDGQPVQVIHPAQELALPLVDLRHLPRAAREVEMRRLAVEEAERRFDLALGPLVRVRLLRTAEKEHVFLLAVHHIAIDQWSKSLFLQELIALYRTFAEGRSSGLPELPIQYADYAHWQRQRLQGEMLARQIAYWKNQLAGPLPVLELATDHPRPVLPSYRGALQSLVLPAPLCAQLDGLNRRAGVTSFMTLLTAFQVLLQRYTGQDDILVGSPIAGRTRLETEKLLGFFVNMLVLRSDLAGNPKFLEALARVRQVALGAYANQDLPFEKLVEELHLSRDSSRHPLFQVVFSLHISSLDGLALPGLVMTNVPVDRGTSAFDLSMTVLESKQGKILECEYSADLFDPATIARLLDHFHTLLKGICANPEQRLADLPLLTPAERRQLLLDWNETTVPYPRDATIQQLFEEQVHATPDAVAVVLGDGQLSYQALNQQANQLAHHLTSLGVGPDVLVGLCLERSLETIVGLLGILKAGGAYLPLDPTCPSERLRWMVDDARLAVVVTRRRLANLVADQRVRLVCLDVEAPVIARQDNANCVCLATADNLAYVMYTSGSTGVPKGVCIPHRGVVRLVKGVHYAELTPQQVFLHGAPLAFDASTFEIWGCLLNGARLVILAEAARPDELGPVLHHYGITILWLTAGLFHLLADTDLAALRSVRQLLAGGDVLSVPQVQKLLRERSGCRLINGYGPTEATTFSCCHEVAEADLLKSSIPIGRPIANTRVYVLDRNLELTPIGVPGELHVGGDGLARGYLNRSELTATQFIPDPFSSTPGARLYKTGDRVRYRPDGTIEFLGRLDNQVKIRGYRIEPAEIEALLNQHPAVGESVVVPRQDVPGEKQLVAFLVLKPGTAPGLEDLRGFLGRRLPAWMIPAAFVSVPALPLTGQGKLDRRKLQTAPICAPETCADHMLPGDPLQVLLTQLWEEMLGGGPIGIRDNFFDRGGHSLLAAAMMARLEQLCGCKLPLATLFAGATVESLAQALVEDQASQLASPLVEVQAGQGRRPFLFLHGDFNGGGFYCRNLARHMGADQPFYVLQPHGLAGQTVPATIEAMANEHLEALRAFQPEGPYFLGGHCNGALEALEIARRLRAEGQPVHLLVLISPPRPRPHADGVRPETPMPTRFDLSRLAPQDRRSVLMQLYRRACASYFAQRYSGRVTIFQPSEHAGPDQPSLNIWKEVAADVETHPVPGNHLTAVTQHVQAVADLLRACMHRAAVDPSRY